MSCILIVADDLTGALDSAVGFAGAGRKVVVARHPHAVPEAVAANPDVLAINTASREIAPDAAVGQVRVALSHLRASDFSIVMKKIDSRLKGNIAVETEALAAWMNAARRVASPAIPSMGRRVRAGALEGEGVAAPVPVADCFSGAVDVPEVASDEDFDAVVLGGDEGVLWIGARGLAFALARKSGVAAPEIEKLKAPVMVANGSRDPVTLAQIGALSPDIQVVQAPDGVAQLTNFTNDEVVLTIADGGAGLSGHEAAKRFALSVEQFSQSFRPAGLLICGGESAHAVLDRLGINSLQVIAELRPGLPLCEVETGWGLVRIVTKSGGFGPPNLLASILEETKAVV